MTLVKVFNNVFLNPSCVGKIEFDVTRTDNTRISTTTVYDVTGQHTLLTARTDISISIFPNDLDTVLRDDFVHREIVAALREGRDARQWRGADPCGIVIRITESEPQHDSFDEDSRRVIADAYRFEMVEGNMSAAMSTIQDGRFAWLAHVASYGSDGWFMLFELPSEYEIEVGMEFDLGVGPRRPH